jgi:uncharacterized protein (TIGR03000 family)
VKVFRCFYSYREAEQAARQEQQASLGGASAELVVTVPPGGSLTIDGKPTAAVSGERRFRSPPLEKGQTYGYELCLSLPRNRQTVKLTKRVLVREGETRRIDFRLPSEAALAGK